MMKPMCISRATGAEQICQRPRCEGDSEKTSLFGYRCPPPPPGGWGGGGVGHCYDLEGRETHPAGQWWRAGMPAASLRSVVVAAYMAHRLLGNRPDKHVDSAATAMASQGGLLRSWSAAPSLLCGCTSMYCATNG